MKMDMMNIYSKMFKFHNCLLQIFGDGRPLPTQCTTTRFVIQKIDNATGGQVRMLKAHLKHMYSCLLHITTSNDVYFKKTSKSTLSPYTHTKRRQRPKRYSTGLSPTRVGQLFDHMRSRDINKIIHPHSSIHGLLLFIQTLRVVAYLHDIDCICMAQRELCRLGTKLLIHHIPSKYRYGLQTGLQLLVGAAKYMCIPKDTLTYTHFQRMLQHTTDALWETHNNHRKILKRINNHYRLHKFVTGGLKRRLNEEINRLVTERQCKPKSPHSPFVSTPPTHIRPAINYHRRVAETALMTIKISRWQLHDLLKFYLAHVYNVHDQVINNTNNLEVVNTMVDMMIARLKRKVIIVNDPYCTCNAKCYGWTNSQRQTKSELYSMFRHVLKEHVEVAVCGTCLLTPVAANTKAQRPCIQINPYNHVAQTCSLDGTCTFHKESLYIGEWDGKLGRYKYAHRFHVNNSINITDALLPNTKLSGALCRLTGICFGGRRNCYQLVHKHISSAALLSREKQQRADASSASATAPSSTPIPHVTITATEYVDLVKTKLRCQSCDSMWGHVHTNAGPQDESRIIGQGKKDKGTCVAQLFRHMKWPCSEEMLTNLSRNICDGCKIRLSCKHVLSRYLDFISENRSELSIFNIRLWRRLYFFHKLCRVFATGESS